MGKEFLQKLAELYGKDEPGRDVFGRRKATREELTGRKSATPAEIQRALEQEPTEAEYPPTEEDIAQKGD